MPIKRDRPTQTKIRGIFEDGDGRFIVRARWTDPKTGKRKKREVVAGTFEDAVALKAELKESAPAERPTRQRLADYAEQWLESHAAELAPSTSERYAAELAHVIVGLGEIYVHALEEEDVRRWRDDLALRLAPSTVNACLRTLRVAIEPLVRREVLRRNPARDVPGLKQGRTKGKRGTSLRADEFQRVIRTTYEMMGKEFSQDIGRMILTIAWTGVRRGELLALKWCDYQDGELHVSRAVCKVTRTEKTTKTDDPRMVSATAPLAAVLEEQRKWLVETQHPGLASGLMFPADPEHAEVGRVRRGLAEVCWYRSGSVLDRPLRKVVEAAGVPPISLHSFRRTYENLLRQAGVSDMVRRSLAGWRTTEAQAIYAGVDREERAEAAAAIVRLVSSAGSTQ